MRLPVYLIHGADELRLQADKRQLLERLLPAELRAENMTEIDPPTNRALELASCLPALLDELGTLSFFAEARRVVVVNNLADFGSAAELRQKAKKTAGAAKKKSASAAPAAGLSPLQLLIRFLDRGLAETRNALLFCYHEDFNKGRRLSTANPLYKFIQQKGEVRSHKSTPEIFEFGDAILRRDLPGALRLFRRIHDADGGPHRVFHTVHRQLRFLIQAKLLQTAGGRGDPQLFAEQNFPAEKNLNLLGQHPFVVKKVQEHARRFNFNELNQALQEAFAINLALFPRSSDVYVPDAALQIELLLIRLCRGN